MLLKPWIPTETAAEMTFRSAGGEGVPDYATAPKGTELMLGDSGGLFFVCPPAPTGPRLSSSSEVSAAL